MERKLENFIDFLHSNELSNNTIISYERDIMDFYEYLKNKEILDYDSVADIHIKEFMKKLTDRGISNSTVYRKSTTIKKFFSFLISKNMIENDPTLKFKRPRVIRETPDCLTREELDEIIKMLPIDSNIGKRDFVILELLFGTGIKVSELINLQVTDIDFNAKHLRVFQNSGRNIPLNENLLLILENYLSTVRDEFNKDSSEALFLNYKGYSISRQGIWKIIKKYSQGSIVDKEINPHTLRNSYAVHLIKIGKKPEHISKIMGYNHTLSPQFFAHCIGEE
ncbi:MAG: tyrosine-type recombinase/integrase [Clostridiales bacterium]|nr:tyrosine-type recombinase/integrase [Clostridiales bacterium]